VRAVVCFIVVASVAFAGAAEAKKKKHGLSRVVHQGFKDVGNGLKYVRDHTHVGGDGGSRPHSGMREGEGDPGGNVLSQLLKPVIQPLPSGPRWQADDGYQRATRPCNALTCKTPLDNPAADLPSRLQEPIVPTR